MMKRGRDEEQNVDINYLAALENVHDSTFDTPEINETGFVCFNKKTPIKFIILHSKDTLKEQQADFEKLANYIVSLANK